MTAQDLPAKKTAELPVAPGVETPEGRRGYMVHELPEDVRKRLYGETKPSAAKMLRTLKKNPDGSTVGCDFCGLELRRRSRVMNLGFFDAFFNATAKGTLHAADVAVRIVYCHAHHEMLRKAFVKMRGVDYDELYFFWDGDPGTWSAAKARDPRRALVAKVLRKAEDVGRAKRYGVDKPELMRKVREERTTLADVTTFREGERKP